MAVTPQEGVTFPVGPAGFDAVRLWAYPELFTFPAGDVPEVWSIGFYSPTQITVDQIDSVASHLRDAASTLGGQLVAYGLWQGPVLDIDVPSQLCFPGTDQCVGIPTQICLPFVGCIPIGGAHLVSAFQYHLWVAFRTGAVASWGYRPFVIAIGLIPMIGILLGVFLIIGFIYVERGQMTTTQYTQMVKDVLRVPGDNIGAATSQIPWTFVGLGVAMIATAALLSIQVQPHAEFKIPGGTVGVTTSVRR